MSRIEYRKRGLSLLLVIVMVVTSIRLSPMRANAQIDENVETKEILQTSYVGDGYEVSAKVTSKWTGAFNAEFIIKNTSDKVIDNWAIQFNMSQEITNIWNGAINYHEDDNYIIKNVGSNQDIGIGESISFGFSANAESEIVLPNEFTLLGFEEEVKEENFDIEFRVTSDWGEAFNGEISIKNKSDETIEDWKLQFEFDRQIKELWNAQIIEQSDNHYYIKNAGYNANIKPGETITLGFRGERGNIEKGPEQYKLSQIITNKSDKIEYIELPDGKIEKDYMYKAIYPNLLLRGLSTENIKLIDDFDGDGLTLIQEYEYDTNPFLADSDEDGLNDNDEIFVHSTEPNMWDTDEDGMSDGTEISSGLNPLVKDTDGNGINDGEESVEQYVRLDYIEDNNLSDVGTLPSVAITGKGDFSSQLQAVKVENDMTIIDINCIVGTPFEFIHDDEMTFESSVLTFEISDEILAKNELEKLAIAWYNEDENALELLDTSFDKKNNSISSNIDHYSTYMVVNVDTYFFDIDWRNEGNIINSGKADVVFVVDTTGSMGSAIKNVRSNINTFVSELEENNIDIRLGLVEYRDIYEDGTGSTKNYDWYSNVNDFKTKLSSLEVDGGGDIPESAVDAIRCARKMKFRTDVKKYIILITDANYKDGVAGDSSVTMEDEIKELISNEIVTSVVTKTKYYSDYELLVKGTDGITGNIEANFNSGLSNLKAKMQKQVNDGCWVRLANSSIVKLDKDPTLGDETIDTDNDGIPDLIELKSSYKVTIISPETKKPHSIDTWSFYSNPAKKDTDGDNISDLNDLRPITYDTTIISQSDDYIKFNSGRVWNNISCNSFDYLDNLYQFIDGVVRNPIPLNKFKKITNNVKENDKQNFSIDELTMIGLLNNEGSKIYMNSKSSYTREKVFKSLAKRESKYYKHGGILWWEDWKEVKKGTKGGFFKGKVLSEADINFSLKVYSVCDIYSVLNTIAGVGAVVISVIVIAKATPIVLANLEGIAYYVKTFGVVQGLNMYKYLGIKNLPNGIITWIQSDLSDGNSSLDDLIDSNIPIYERGKTGEEALKFAHPGESQKYFQTYVNGVKGGRYVDQYSQRVAYEAKVGYTCLSNRIKTQVLKDAYLLADNQVKGVVWEFYRSEITGRVGATQSLLDYLTAHGIEYIIHK